VLFVSFSFFSASGGWVTSTEISLASLILAKPTHKLLHFWAFEFGDHGGVYRGPSGVRNSRAGRRDNRPPTVLSFPPQENPRVDIPSHQRKPVVNNSTHQRELVVNKTRLPAKVDIPRK